MPSLKYRVSLCHRGELRLKLSPMLLVAPVDTHCHLKKMVLEKWTKDHGTRHPKTESLILLYHGAATNETRSKSSAPQITFVPTCSKSAASSQEIQQALATLFLTRRHLRVRAQCFSRHFLPHLVLGLRPQTLTIRPLVNPAQTATNRSIDIRMASKHSSCRLPSPNPSPIHQKRTRERRSDGDRTDGRRSDDDRSRAHRRNGRAP
jgi:hypothetical protein